MCTPPCHHCLSGCRAGAPSSPEAASCLLYVVVLRMAPGALPPGVHTLCCLLSHCIRTDPCDLQNSAHVMVCDFRGEVTAGIAAPTLVPQIAPSERSQTPCHEDSRAAMWRGLSEALTTPLPTVSINLPALWWASLENESSLCLTANSPETPS